MFSFYEASRSKKYGRTSANMYLQFKWDMENYATHRFNVKTAKPSIDNSAPRTYTHMFIRPKKLQLELERYSTIQRNNRFLLERIATVHREGAWIDNKNYHEIKSLNTWARQQEMINLAYNNQIMIARLQDVNEGHNWNKLEDEYLINQKYKANILKYPPNWREIQEHLNLLKKETFKKIFDSKYQKQEYQKSRKRVLGRWAAETEKHAASKAEKLAKEAEEKEPLTREIKKEVAAEGKNEPLKKESKGKSKRSETVKLTEEKEQENLRSRANQNIEMKKKPPKNEKVEAKKKIYSTESEKAHDQKVRNSNSKTNNIKKYEGGKSQKGKAKSDFSNRRFEFKGDNKNKRGEVTREKNQHTKDSKLLQDQTTISDKKEKNEIKHPVPNKLKSEDGVAEVTPSTVSDVSKQFEREKTASKKDEKKIDYEEESEDQSLEPAEDHLETELSELSEQNEDDDESASFEVFSSGNQSETENNQALSEQSSFTSSNETENSKEDEDRS